MAKKKKVDPNESAEVQGSPQDHVEQDVIESEVEKNDYDSHPKFAKFKKIEGAE